MQSPPKTFVAFAVVAAVGIAATVVATQVSTPAVAQAGIGPEGGDGLNRYVVELASVTTSLEPTSTAPTSTPSAPPSSAPAGSAAPDGAPAQPGSGAALGQIDFARFAAAQAELGAGGTLVRGATDAEVLYVVGGRSRVVSSGDVATGRRVTPTLATATAPAAPSSASAPKPKAPKSPIELLAAAEGIEHVTALPDGTAVVATSLSHDAVAQVPGVAEVRTASTIPYADAEIYAAAAPNDPYFSYDWHLKNTTTPGADIGALDAWSATQGQGTIVAVLDSGFDSNHPDLEANLWQNPREACNGGDANGNGLAGDCHGWNFYANSADIDNGPGGYHGTMVSGTVAAVAGNGAGGAGVAPQAKIMPLVVGSGGSVYPDLVPAAIRYAVDNGASVINGSFGGTITGTTLANLRSAVDYANAHGVIFVVAAGNDSLNRDTSMIMPANLTEPNVITVGASTSTDSVASFSAYGAVNVDLFAPGQQILVTYNDGGYRLADGTSFASPVVAGAVALYRSLNPTWTATQIKDEILRTATPKPAFSGKSVSGARLSLANLGGAGTSLRYYFAGAGRQTTNAVRPSVSIMGNAPAGAYTAKVSLGLRYEGEVWAVSGVDLGINGQSTVTDDDGTVSVPVDSARFSAGEVIMLDTTVPEGDYVLVAQLFDSSGTAVTRPFAAPLSISLSGFPSASASPTGTGGTAPPTGTATPPPAGPGGSAATGSATGGATGTATSSTSRSTSPAATSPGGGGGGGGAGGGATSSTSRSTSAAGSSSAAGGGGGAGGASSSAATSSRTSSSAATTPGNTPGNTATVTPVAPNPTTGATSTSGAGGGGGEQTFPGTDPFQITRISPANVTTAGGTLVTIEGDNLPATPSVRIGTSGTATVLAGGTSTSLTFRTPARAAGVYDVTVYTADRRSSTLADALTYADPGAAPTATSTTAPTTRATTPAATTPAATTPAASNPASTSRATTPGATTPVPTTPAGTTPPGGLPTSRAPQSTAPQSTAGQSTAGQSTASQSRATTQRPNGLRLVRPGAGGPFSSVPGGLWDATGCEGTCVGSQM